MTIPYYGLKLILSTIRLYTTVIYTTVLCAVQYDLGERNGPQIASDRLVVRILRNATRFKLI